MALVPCDYVWQTNQRKLTKCILNVDVSRKNLDILTLRGKICFSERHNILKSLKNTQSKSKQHLPPTSGTYSCSAVAQRLNIWIFKKAFKSSMWRPVDDHKKLGKIFWLESQEIAQKKLFLYLKRRCWPIFTGGQIRSFENNMRCVHGLWYSSFRMNTISINLKHSVDCKRNVCLTSKCDFGGHVDIVYDICHLRITCFPTTWNSRQTAKDTSVWVLSSIFEVTLAWCLTFVLYDEKSFATTWNTLQIPQVHTSTYALAHTQAHTKPLKTTFQSDGSVWRHCLSLY